MRANCLISSVASALVLAAVARTAIAGPTETFGFFSRSTAMGGATSADATDASANFYNPAGLAGARSLTLEVGYVSARSNLQTDGKSNHVDPVRGIVFGLVAPGELAGLPFAFGLGLHLPNDRVFRVRSIEQSQPRWELYDNAPQRIYLSANLAVKPVKWLEIGAGMTFLSSTRASLDITGRLNIEDVNASRLRHEVDADLKSVEYPELGVRVLATERLRFAAVYRGEFQLDLDIRARLSVEADALGLRIPFLTLIETKSVNAFLPRNVVVGASFDATDDVTLDADVTWVQWSAYRSPVTHVDATTKLDAPPGFPASLVPASPAPTDVKAPNFSNRIVPRIGAEWRVPLGDRARGHTLALRAGYFYERSPVPPQTSITNFVDADRHAFSLGVGVNLHHLGDVLRGDVRFDVHAQLSVFPDRAIEKSSGADLIGDYRAGGTIMSIGATLGVVF